MRRRLSDAYEASRRLSDTYEPSRHLSDAYETSRRLRDAYETSRRLSDAYGHIFKKKLSLWFLVGLKKEIDAPLDFSVRFWI